MTDNRQPLAAATDQWANVQERGSYWGMRLLVVLYRCGGHILLYPIVWGVVFYFFLTRATTRRYSRLYLKRVGLQKVGIQRDGLQRGGKMPVRLWDIWLHHLAFAQSLLDRIGAWLGKIKRSDVPFAGHQTLVELKAQKKGAVLLGAHLGNLEMCRAVVENDGSMVLNVILHSHNTQKFNQLMEKVNPQTQVRLIQVDDITPATAMRLRAMLERGEFLILLADRLPPGNQERYFEQTFLGTPARFPAGPFWLALLLGAPIYFLVGLRTREGFRAFMEPLSDGEPVARKARAAECQRIVALYAEKLQRFCCDHPYQWFNFYDFWQDDLP